MRITLPVCTDAEGRLIAILAILPNPITAVHPHQQNALCLGQREGGGLVPFRLLGDPGVLTYRYFDLVATAPEQKIPPAPGEYPQEPLVLKVGPE